MWQKSQGFIRRFVMLQFCVRPWQAHDARVRPTRHDRHKVGFRLGFVRARWSQTAGALPVPSRS